MAQWNPWHPTFLSHRGTLPPRARLQAQGPAPHARSARFRGMGTTTRGLHGEASGPARGREEHCILRGRGGLRRRPETAQRSVSGARIPRKASTEDTSARTSTAVCPKDGQLVCPIVPHNDREVFKAFLDTIADEVLGKGKKVWLVLDNASWHHAKSLD